MDLNSVQWEDVDWIRPIKASDERRSFVNSVIKIKIP
jgi:hypothetical protein